MLATTECEEETKKRRNEARFVDIGANLLDPMYRGMYHGKVRHIPDLSAVLKRAEDVDRIIVLCGTLQESKEALDLATQYPRRIYTTVGIHPTRCSTEFGSTEESTALHIQKLRQLLQQRQHNNTNDDTAGVVVAIGEIGLDYDRTEFSNVISQKRGFIAQLDLAREFQYPLILHNRNTGCDLLQLLRDNRHKFNKAVVHSFDDSLELAMKFIELGNVYIGINGCSLKTSDNLKVVQHIPLEKMVLETDGPWCDIRPTHAGYQYVHTKFETKKKFQEHCCIKGRTEPCHIVQIAEIVAAIQGVTVDIVAEHTRRNSYDLFWNGRLEE